MEIGTGYEASQGSTQAQMRVKGLLHDRKKVRKFYFTMKFHDLR